MRFASIPALFASAEPSSIESALPRKLKGGTKRSLTRCNYYSLPDSDTPQDDNVSRFTLASIPVLNSSISKFIEFLSSRVIF